MEKSDTDKRIDELAARSGRFEADVKERFNRVDREFDKVDRRFERFEDKVDAEFEKVDARFDKVDARFDKVDAEFEKVGGRFKEMATKEELAKIDARLDRWGKVVTGGVVAIAGSVIAKVLGL